MTIKDLYIEISSNKDTYDQYCFTGQNSFGKMFAFINTNYRSIFSMSGKKYGGFAKGFEIINQVCGKKRSEWEKKETTNQEKQKQHTVAMQKSELFSVENDIYKKTSRGIVFERMLQNEELSLDEKRLLCYLLIVSGYFDNIPNYIFHRTKEVFVMFEDAGYCKEDVLSILFDFINMMNDPNHTNEDIINHTYFIMDAFYSNTSHLDFLAIYKDSSEENKRFLHEYIYNNYVNRRYENTLNKCLLSYKFKPSGVYTFNTLLCNAWILYLSQKIQDCKIGGFDDFINNIVIIYNSLFKIDEKNIKKFIYNTDKNRSVFQIIYCNLFNITVPILDMEKDLTPEEIQRYGKLDSTDEEGVILREQITQSLKKMAKINANYKCEMEEIELCKYFTAKETHKNYLEIHHLIPREFANDFEISIEDIRNYIALCPNCHRKIHLAEDGERKHLINKLYNDRREKLSKYGIDIDVKTLYSYYKIDK